MQSPKKPIPVNLPDRLKWVERVAYLLDDQFRIPGTNFRFGLDPIINFIPVVGDISGFAVAATLIWVMAKQGASRKVVILMALNAGLDALIGGIPIIGQIFDFYFKANERNIRLLKQHYVEGRHQGSGTGVLVTIFIVIGLFFAGILYLSYKLLRYLVHLF
ncbi:DUF4112 domain-containing protein [Mucilaginibacter sp. Bleaf8]|uniref:DUF4112 domain-containing protein n=1 Tax=Mucilaginibacter sp. Bleaf8 TaxID=2834430 RepID=UPI001BCA982D|nr:DUF4112 domain-containing protein [Mucilaginibacter sp. Bleaf8]MBS7565889.1 DUF4112 domain-containing protein [Mucilaginibacter sp. Bleaf8]